MENGRSSVGFFLIGLNHLSAPVEIREKFAGMCVSGLPGADGNELEAVTVLTCNRAEAYFFGDETSGENLFENWLLSSGHDPRLLSPFLYHKTARESILHLFRVVSGLDSMILGESQILHQVKSSYQAAIDAGSVGKNLHTLFQKALEVGKRVRRETRISENTVSIASTAVEMAQSIFGPLEDSLILVIGAGEMAALTAKHMSERGGKNLWFANRTISRAEELAGVFNGKATHLSDVPSLLERADVVISSTGAPQPIITSEMIHTAMSKRQCRPLFLIDIAVPRDIEPEVNSIDSVFLYNIDDLQNVVDENFNLRKQEALKAMEIIDREILAFEATLNAFSVIPLIRVLREHAENIRNTEMERFFPSHRNLPPEIREEIDQLTRSLLAKWLHHPLVSLKKRSLTSRHSLMQIAKLFGLPEQVIPNAPLVGLTSSPEAPEFPAPIDPEEAIAPVPSDGFATPVHFSTSPDSPDFPESPENRDSVMRRLVEKAGNAAKQRKIAR
jgi:glutamyl-tRNA reductase